MFKLNCKTPEKVFQMPSLGARAPQIRIYHSNLRDTYDLNDYYLNSSG